MITVVSAQDAEQVRGAREHAAVQAGWWLFFVVLTAAAAGLAWVGLPGVWPVLLWVLAGLIGADVLTGAGSVWVAVREWRRMRGSAAYRALCRELDAAERRAWEAYRAARRAEVTRAVVPDGGDQ